MAQARLVPAVEDRRRSLRRWQAAEKLLFLNENRVIDEDDVLRGDHRGDPGWFSYVSFESRVPKSHPLRKVRKIVDDALQAMDTALDAMYAGTGQPSIAPERLIRALLLQVLYSVRSERMLVEQLDYSRALSRERWSRIRL